MKACIPYIYSAMRAQKAQLQRSMRNTTNRMRVLRTSFPIAIYLLCISLISSAQISYVDAADSLGINHIYTTGVFGGGVSCFDFNQDGRDDLTFATPAGENLVLYLNTGAGFTEILSPVTSTGQSKHVLWVDFDNDTDPDLYVTNYGGVNQLFRNDGLFSFTNITGTSGLPLIPANSYGACWGDYDRDGDLDLYQTNHGTDPSSISRLYMNNGDETFTDVTVSSGIGELPGLSFAAAFIDLDHDGWPDIYEAVDKASPNRVLHNNGDGTFTDVGASSGGDIIIDAMCVAFADYDRNGYQDVYVSNTPTAGNNVLLSNTDGNNFTDVSAAAGVEFFGIGWGSVFLDADCDMDPDLYASGMITGTWLPSSSFFENNNDGTFSIPTGAGFEGDTIESFSNAVGDFNADGYPDFAVSNRGYQSNLWINDGGSNNYLMVELESTFGNHFGVGSWISVYTDGIAQNFYSHCGISFLGQNSGTMCIGLADNDFVDSLIVEWPSGVVTKMESLCANQHITVREGALYPNSPLSETEAVVPLCDGATITLGASIGLPTYEWNTGATTRTLPVTDPGTYWVKATSAFGTCHYGEVRIIKTFDPVITDFEVIATSPLAATGSATVQVVGGSPPYDFQWLDPMMQTTQTATNLWVGEYGIIIRDEANCRITDSVFVGAATGLDFVDVSEWTLSPVPASTFIQLNFESAAKQSFNITISDMKGSVVAEHEVSAGANSYRIEFELESGLYLISTEYSSLPFVVEQPIAQSTDIKKTKKPRSAAAKRGFCLC